MAKDTIKFILVIIILAIVLNSLGIIDLSSFFSVTPTNLAGGPPSIAGVSGGIAP